MAEKDEKLVSRIYDAEKSFSKLDIKDKKLLYYLSRNFRLQIQDLSELLLLSRKTVEYRLNRLLEEKIILSSISVINPVMLGFEVWLIVFKFQNTTPGKESELIKQIKNDPSVFWLLRVTGKWDAMMGVFAKDMHDFTEKMHNFRSLVGSNLGNYDFVAWLSEFKYRNFIEGYFQGVELDKNYYKKLSPIERMLEENIIEIIERKQEIKNIDKTDLEILEALSENVRTPYNEIARNLEISLDKVKYRITKMIENNVLSGFWPSINLSKLGLEWYILFIRLRNASPKQRNELGAFLKNHKFVVKAYTTLGLWDMVIDLYVYNTAHFTEILNEIKEKFHGIIQDYESLLVMQEIHYTHFVKEFYKALPELKALEKETQR